MDRRNIAVIYGGYSSEEVVSRKSAEEYYPIDRISIISIPY